MEFFLASSLRFRLASWGLRRTTGVTKEARPDLSLWVPLNLDTSHMEPFEGLNPESSTGIHGAAIAVGSGSKPTSAAACCKLGLCSEGRGGAPSLFPLGVS